MGRRVDRCCEVVCRIPKGRGVESPLPTYVILLDIIRVDHAPARGMIQLFSSAHLSSDPIFLSCSLYLRVIPYRHLTEPRHMHKVSSY